jgi:hypothetical protein
MATNFQIQVALDNATLAVLATGWQLQVYKGVKSSTPGGLPTIWFTVETFSNQMALNWAEQFGGYVSDQTVANGVVVNASSQQSMDLGDLMTLESDGQTEVSTDGGVVGAITIGSQKTSEWTCGMTQSMNGSVPTAICAFPLYGAADDIMEPYECIVLLFASSQTTTGTVVEEAITSSATVTLSGTTANVALSFDINSGWAAAIPGDPSVAFNPPNVDLAEILIIPGSSEAKKHRERKHRLAK